MYYTIYEVDTAPITYSRMDACSIGEHIVFIEKGRCGRRRRLCLFERRDAVDNG